MKTFGITVHTVKILNRNPSSDFKVLAFKFTTEVTGVSKFMYGDVVCYNKIQL